MGNSNEDFENKEEALEFLLGELSDRKQKEEWARTLPGNPEQKRSVLTVVKRRLWIVSGVAASILIVFLFLFNNKEEPFDHEMLALNMTKQTTMDFDVSTRGDGMNNEKENDVLKHLNDANYNDVIRYYNGLNTNLAPSDKMLLAYALFKGNDVNDDRVLALTEDLIESNGKYKADALWIRAVTYLKMNDLDRVEEDLAQLKSFKYKSQEIDEILDKINTHKH